MRPRIAVFLGLVVLGSLAVDAAGCGDDARTTRAHRARPRRPGTPAAAQPGATEEPPPPSPWPADVGDLRTEVEQFAGERDCAERLPRGIPVALAETISDLGYDTIVADSCGSLAALHERSPERCDRLGTTAVRRGCRLRLALLAADPAFCPPDQTSGGRDALCIAWALRDASMCRGAASLEAARCRAVLAHDARACSAASIDATRCRAESRRYASALSEGRPLRGRVARDPELHVELRVVTSDDSAPAETRVIDSPALARGAYLEPRGCVHHVTLGGSPSVAVLDETPTISLALDLDRSVHAGSRLDVGALGAVLDVDVPGMERASSATGATGRVVITALDRERGGALAGTISATLPLVGGRLAVEGRFRTFVRDLDPLPACE